MLADDLRQPTCAEALSPAIEGYLRERIAQAAGALATRCDQIRLYQCLADPGSALALGEDLLALARQPGPAGLAAVFECPPVPHHQGFAGSLWRHLRLMHKLVQGIEMPPQAPAEADAELLLRVEGRLFHLIALHPDAGRLSRVMPCPLLLFQTAAR